MSTHDTVSATEVERGGRERVRREREEIYRIFQLVQLFPTPNQSFSFPLLVTEPSFDLVLHDEWVSKWKKWVHRLGSREKW